MNSEIKTTLHQAIWALDRQAALNKLSDFNQRRQPYTSEHGIKAQLYEFLRVRPVQAAAFLGVPVEQCLSIDDQEVLGNLCCDDPRNPDFYRYDDEDPVTPREDCSCDNCFYGRDALALEIIRLRAAAGTPILPPGADPPHP